MTLHEQLFADLIQPALTEMFGEAAEYVDQEGTATTITAQFGDERQAEEQTEQGRKLRRELSCTISRSEVADPSIQGKIRRNGEDWPIDEVRGKSNMQVMLRLLRIESIERSRPGYRNK